jgi:hypothetical protein
MGGGEFGEGFGEECFGEGFEEECFGEGFGNGLIEWMN